MSKTHVKGNHHLGRAIWTDGRFVSLSAFLSKPGEVVTPPIRFSGNRLQLNMNAGASGTVKVAIERADGTPIPGYTLKDAKPRYGNDLHKEMKWQSGADLSALAGEPLRLRFQLQAARLYGFQFALAKWRRTDWPIREQHCNGHSSVHGWVIRPARMDANYIKYWPIRSTLIGVVLFLGESANRSYCNPLKIV